MPSEPVHNPRAATRRRWLNAVVPGTGLILAGRPLAGIGTGLAFAATLNAALAIWLLIPDDLPRTAVWCGLAAALSYLLAQFLLIRADANDRSADSRDARRAALTALITAVREGRPDAAAAARLQLLAETDLHAAFRLAQGATLDADAQRALEAWERVRRLDPHHIYRSETQDQLRRLRERSAPDAERS